MEESRRKTGEKRGEGHLRKHNSFFHKLLVLLVTVGVLPLFIIGILTYGFSRELFLEQYSRHALERVQVIADNLERLVEEHGMIIHALAEDPEIRRALAEGTADRQADIEQHIHLLLSGRNIKPSVYVLDRTGSLSFGTGELPRSYNPVRHADWGIFRIAREGGGETRPYAHRFSGEDGGAVFSLIRALTDEDGDITGYIIADTERDALERIIRREGSLYPLDFLIMDRYGFLLLDTAEPELEGTLDRTGYRKLMREDGEPVLHAHGDGRESILQFAVANGADLTVIAEGPYEMVRHNTDYIRVMFITAAALSLLASLAFAYGTAKRMSTPIIELVKGMKKVSRGDFSVRIASGSKDEFELLGNGFNQMTEQIEKLLQSVREAHRRFRIAESKALMAQINPHFIYNTLDLIKWSAKMNETEQVNRIVTQLGRLLRGVIHVKREKVTVREEMDLVDSYMNIQKIRFSDRLFFHFHIDPDIMEATIPRFTIHPLVENAIVHGFENKNGKMFLMVNGSRREGDLVFEIIDNGIGMGKETIERIFSEQNGDGTGILNVHKRIQLYYGLQYGIRIHSEPDKGTIVTVRMPQQGGEEHVESRGD